MSKRKICCLVLLVLGLLAIAVSVIVILALPKCAPGSYLHAAVAADTEICSNIGRYVHGLFCLELVYVVQAIEPE